jgi:hypothetical protein
MMTAIEIIDELKKLPPDAECRFFRPSTGEYIEIESVVPTKEKPDGSVSICVRMKD